MLLAIADNLSKQRSTQRILDHNVKSICTPFQTVFPIQHASEFGESHTMCMRLNLQRTFLAVLPSILQSCKATAPHQQTRILERTICILLARTIGESGKNKKANL